jgi:hypothetical protein
MGKGRVANEQYVNGAIFTKLTYFAPLHLLRWLLQARQINEGV